MSKICRSNLANVHGNPHVRWLQEKSALRHLYPTIQRSLLSRTRAVDQLTMAMTIVTCTVCSTYVFLDNLDKEGCASSVVANDGRPETTLCQCNYGASKPKAIAASHSAPVVETNRASTNGPGRKKSTSRQVLVVNQEEVTL